MNIEAHVSLCAYVGVCVCLSRKYLKACGCCDNTSLKVRLLICCGFRKCQAHLDTPLTSISFSSLCSRLLRKFCSVHFTAGGKEEGRTRQMWLR